MQRINPDNPIIRVVRALQDFLDSCVLPCAGVSAQHMNDMISHKWSLVLIELRRLGSDYLFDRGHAVATRNLDAGIFSLSIAMQVRFENLACL